MKRFLVALLLLVAMAVPAYAIVPMYDKSNIEVGVEYGYSHQDIEDINVIGVGVGDFLGAGLTEKTSNVKEWSFLATLGYKISPQLTPYLIVGDGFINLDQELSGHASIGDWSGSIPILTTQLRGASGFLVGGGAKGELLEFNNGITIGYDTRWTTLNVSSTDRDAKFLGSDYLTASNKMKASLGVFTLDMVVSKYFDLEKKVKNEDGTVTVTKKYVIKGITPFLGGRWTHSDLNVKNSITIDMRRSSIGIGTESETQGNMLSGLGGVKVQINDKVNASVAGIIGQENGVFVKVGYNF
jgi:hypothetical protein